ncbi:unnamed protein product [Boreogadus saida]
MDATRKAVVAVALAEYRRSKIGLPAPTPRHRAVHERYSSSKDEPGQVTVAVATSSELRDGWILKRTKCLRLVRNPAHSPSDARHAPVDAAHGGLKRCGELPVISLRSWVRVT